MSYLEDGFATLISFASAPAITLKEKEVTPPGIDGGDAIDITTMRNTDWRTFAARQLKTLTESSITAAYDPVVYNDILEIINVNQLITITFPNGSTLAFWGHLQNFTPGANTEGEQPTAECRIIPSNKNASGVETAPVYTPAP